MDPIELKSRFGDSITFWGGGIDTQHVLNSGSAQDVKDAVKRSVDAFAPGGVFVFCPVHNVQPDVPPENLFLAYESFDSLGTYG
jgi:uroporphyrinogen decarboxylase